MMERTDKNILRLLERFFTGKLSAEEREELEKWLEERVENRRFLKRFGEERAFVQRYKAREDVDVEAAIRAFDRRTEGKSAGIQRRKRRLWSAGVAGVAAMLAVMLGIGVLWTEDKGEERRLDVVAERAILPGSGKAVLVLADGERMVLAERDSLEVGLAGGGRILSRGKQLVYEDEGVKVGGREEEKAGGEIRYNELQVPRGGEFEVVLADGSFVKLNAGARLRYPEVFDGRCREVSLTGEGWFEVAKGAIPFVVRVGELSVKVYGTSFNINAEERGRIEMALVEGKVGISVEGGDQEYFLKPSQLATFDAGRKTMVVRETDLAPYLAWTKGLFMFDNEPLEGIMEKLAQWYDVEVFYRNRQVKELHFTGVVKRYDYLDEILRALSHSVGVRFERQGRTITVGYQ